MKKDMLNIILQIFQKQEYTAAQFITSIGKNKYDLSKSFMYLYDDNNSLPCSFYSAFAWRCVYYSESDNRFNTLSAYFYRISSRLFSFLFELIYVRTVPQESTLLRKNLWPIENC